jgi:hypothetical protein
MQIRVNIYPRVNRSCIRLTTCVVLFCSLPYSSAFAFAPSANSVTGAHFSYDRDAPLNFKQIAVREQDGVTVQDITHTGSNGDTIPAYLVIPK